MITRIAQVFLLALLLGGMAHAEVPIPPLNQRITDLSGTLDAQQIRTLDARLADFEAEKGVQFAVLIVPSTQPESIEQFGIRMADAWKLGRKGVDDGALLLIAKDDRTLRIEVGYGLEGSLTDATSHRIIDEIIVPYFRRGEFFQGIDAGLTAMMQVAGGEPLPAPAHGKPDYQSLIFMGFVIAVALGGLLRAMLGRFPAAVLVGGVMGVLAWLVVASGMVAALAGLAAFVFVLLGGGYGGGFGGGGFSGGGFGGGGGGFGGGGASGRW